MFTGVVWWEGDDWRYWRRVSRSPAGGPGCPGCRRRPTWSPRRSPSTPPPTPGPGCAWRSKTNLSRHGHPAAHAMLRETVPDLPRRAARRSGRAIAVTVKGATPSGKRRPIGDVARDLGRPAPRDDRARSPTPARVRRTWSTAYELCRLVRTAYDPAVAGGVRRGPRRRGAGRAGLDQRRSGRRGHRRGRRMRHDSVLVGVVDDDAAAARDVAGELPHLAGRHPPRRRPQTGHPAVPADPRRHRRRRSSRPTNATPSSASTGRPGSPPARAPT